MSWSVVTRAGSNVTRASLSRKLTSARCTPGSPSRARLTATGQAPQVIPSTDSTTVDCAASTTCAANRSTNAATQNPCPRIIASSPAHALHVMPDCAVPASVTQADQDVRGHFGEPIEQNGCHHDEARQDQQTQGGPAACHAAGEPLAPATLPDVEGETRRHAENPRWNQDPSVLHGHRHERAAPEAEGDDGQRQETAERRQQGAGPSGYPRAQRAEFHGFLLRTCLYRYRANPAKPMSRGNRTRSRRPVSAPRPIAPSSNTSAGVRQARHVSAAPITPRTNQLSRHMAPPRAP